MKPKTLILLTAALAVCVVFIVLRLGYRELVGQKQAVSAEATLFQTAPLGATELTLVSGEGARLAFAKVGGVWRMVEPVEAKADRLAVDELADPLISPQVTAVTGEDAADSITGLDRPQGTITLTDQRGRTYRLAIGRAAVLSGGARTYVRDEETQRVFVAAFNFTAELARPVGDWRDKGLWDLRQQDIRRVAVAGRDSYELIHREDRWDLVAPRFRGPADVDKVRLLLDRLAYLTVSNFVTDTPEGLAIYGLDNPRLTVTVELLGPPAPAGAEAAATTAPATQPATAEAGPTHTLALGAAVGEKVYAKLSGSATVFQLPASSLEELQPALASLRDRHVLPVEPAAVRGVDLELPGGRTVLVGQDDRWHMELPFAGLANWGAVSVFLERLQSLQAESFVDEAAPAAAYGLAAPRGTITLHLADRDQPAQLLIGGQSPSGDMTFVKSAVRQAHGPEQRRGADLECVAVLRTTDAQALLEGAATYWDTTLLKLPATQRATSLEIRRDKEPIALAAGEPGPWRMTRPVSAPADAAAVEELLAALRDLSAQRIVSLDTAVPKTYAKAPGLITVKLTATVPPPPEPPASAPATPQAATTTYTLCAVKQEGSVYAWLEGRSPAAVGLVSSGLFDKLTAEFRSRDVGPPAGAEAELIKITLEDSECVLQRLLGQWRCHADPHVVISAVKVDAFCQNVRLLKAQRFVSYRAGAEKQKEFGLKQPYLSVEITATDGQTYKVAVSDTGPEGSGARYASCTAVDGVFLLSGQSILGLSKTLEDFKE